MIDKQDLENILDTLESVLADYQMTQYPSSHCTQQQRKLEQVQKGLKRAIKSWRVK